MKHAFRRAVGRLLEAQVRRLIKARKLTVIAVAGSVGKTSTKMAIATVIGQTRRVMVEQGNYNSEIGLPLMVFGQTVPAMMLNPFAWIVRLVRAEQQIRGDYPYDVVVLELGTDHPGEIAHFLTYLSPDIGVVTAVAPEHMENFDGLEAVAAEELGLAKGCKQVLLGTDDIKPVFINRFVPKSAHVTTFGTTPKADYAVVSKDLDADGGTDCALLKHGHATIVGLTLPAYGQPALRAAAAAYGVADLLGLERSEIEAGLQRFEPVSGRMRPFAGINHSLLLDDTYNSSPEAVTAAMNTLISIPATGKRIAVMGSMNELGPNSATYHAQAGAACAGVDLLVTIGRDANQYLGPGAVAAGLDERNWKPADSPYAAGEFLKLLVGRGDIVLIKGSQNGVFAEECTKLLLAEAADAQYLVRQSPAWLAKKAKQFEV